MSSTRVHITVATATLKQIDACRAVNGESRSQFFVRSALNQVHRENRSSTFDDLDAIDDLLEEDRK